MKCLYNGAKSESQSQKSSLNRESIIEFSLLIEPNIWLM